MPLPPNTHKQNFKKREDKLKAVCWSNVIHIYCKKEGRINFLIGVFWGFFLPIKSGRKKAGSNALIGGQNSNKTQSRFTFCRTFIQISDRQQR